MAADTPGSAPAPLITNLQDLLATHPAPVAPLPPWLRDGATWRDMYLALPAPAVADVAEEPLAEAEEQTSTPQAAKNGTLISLPPLPVPSILAPTMLEIPDSAASVKDEASVSASTLRIPRLPRAGTPAPSSFRHSLVMLDNLTGDVVGVLAEGVNLAVPPSASALSPAASALNAPPRPVAARSAPPPPPPPKEPKELPIERAASIYIDSMARRPSSRPGSILGADTFAPPPVPVSKDHLAPTSRESGTSVFFSAAESAASESDAESDAEEGFAKLRLDGAEATRPDLLRDQRREASAASDASGSTVGGPAVRLWCKARGKKSKPEKAAPEQVLAAVPRRELQVSEASVRTSRAETAAEELCASAAASSDEDAAPQPLIQALVPALPHRAEASHIRGAEDALWRAAFETESLPLDAPYTHLAASFGTTKQQKREAVDEGMEMLSASEAAARQRETREVAPMMRGGTVLLEFLAGSRIGATLLPDSSAPAESTAAPVKEENAMREGVMAYVPVLPAHFLWWLGISPSANSHAPAAAPSPAAEPSAALSSLVALSPDVWRLLALPSSLSDTVITGASSAWSGLSSYMSLAWGSLPALSPSAASDTDSNGPLTPSDVDADAVEVDSEAWEWQVPAFRPDSLDSTPRPVYRRKRPLPSAMGGFAVREASLDAQQREQRYSIVHYDGEGIGRRAVVSVPGVRA
jgi:hypothetical protein